MALDLNRIRGLPWHEAARAALRAVHERGHHALLLHGQAGIGKKGLAMDFAAEILCEAGPGQPRPCGRCPGCTLFVSGNHPDLRIVVPDALAWLRPSSPDEEGGEAEESVADEERRATRVSREIKIDHVRAIGALVGVTTHRAGQRVVLLAPAEALNVSAGNALLKLLEEPPPRTQFLLVSDRIDEVLPTILSRCVLLRVAPPPRDAALRWLREQGLGEAEDALDSAGGAPLKALEQQSEEGAALPPATAGLLLTALARGPGLDIVDTGARLPRSPALPETIDLFQRWGWDLLAIRQSGRVRYHRKHRDILSRLARDVPEGRLLAWIDSLREARAAAEHTLNPRLVIEALLVDYVSCLRREELPPKAAAGV